MLSTVRIGMVGAGAVAARHLRTLLAMDGVEVAAVADPALERAKELAAEAGAAVYPNHMELLEAERLDAVYICVPPFAHGAPELAVIDAGLPMFVEKPVAIDQETAAVIAAGIAWPDSPPARLLGLEAAPGPAETVALRDPGPERQAGKSPPRPVARGRRPRAAVPGHRARQDPVHHRPGAVRPRRPQPHPLAPGGGPAPGTVGRDRCRDRRYIDAARDTPQQEPATLARFGGLGDD